MSSTDWFTYDIPLRWTDLDAQGHVNNAIVVDYLQEARVAFLLSGPNAHLLGNGVIVVAHHVEFVASIDFRPEPLRARLAVGEVGASRFEIGYDLSQGDQVVARARTELCLYDFTAGRPTRLSPAERAELKASSTVLPALRDLGRWRVGERAHESALRVRWSDLDAYGHVNNTRFFDYVAEARVAMNAELLPNAIRSGMTDEVEHVWLVVRQDVAYLGQIAHRLADYRVRTAVASLGRTSMTLVAEIDDPVDARVLARSLTVLVHADASGTPQPLPESVRAAAAAWPAEGLKPRS